MALAPGNTNTPMMQGTPRNFTGLDPMAPNTQVMLPEEKAALKERRRIEAMIKGYYRSPGSKDDAYINQLEQYAAMYGIPFERKRVIDEEIYDPDGIVSLSSNQFTLQAGTYRIWWNFPGYQVDKHNTKLYNVTDTANVAAGTAEKSGDSENTQTRSSGFTRVTISGAKAFEIRHICAVTKSNNGLGENAYGSDMSTNYIGWVQILKEN